ncbi:hypothetical protein WA026_008515 [Henosepilachna vigintioctopunctata]|uniref:Uncharacterized protein n=1 Tax=Henosepilachna vigintioctopunctata TaxID=420089 RepID=A0AAW1UFQ9_9CUCU
MCMTVIICHKSNPLIPDNLRLSQRQGKVKSYEDNVTYLCTKEDNSMSSSEGIFDLDVYPIQETLSRPVGEIWKEAMKNELKSFSENEAWNLVDQSENGVIVG